MMKKTLAFLAILLLLPLQAFAADGTSYVYQGYTYDSHVNDKSTPAPFLLSKVIDASCLGGIPLDRVDDVCAAPDGRIFLTDSKQSRVHVLDETGALLKSIKTIRDADNKIVINADGSQLVLNGCQGTFYHAKRDELYIADTLAMRVIVLDGATYCFKRVLCRPANMTGETEFKPSKIAVDPADRVYIVVQSSYEGIVELNEDGTFSRYFGVNEPDVNLIDYFWKSIATDAQKEKMSKIYAPAFDNVAIDGEGFVMAVTSERSVDKYVFRLNFAGKNVLREEGLFAYGDFYSMDDRFSAFTDLAVTPYGAYATLDKNHGRVFLYNFDGELLSAFGTMGNLVGEFKSPSGICFLGNKLVIADSTLKCAYILTPTEFGVSLLRASEAYYAGRWDEATAYYEDALRLCGNLDVAYVGIGKSWLMKEDYEKAMYYFKLGSNREYYSKAYAGYRNEVLRENFGWIAAGLALLIGAVVYSEIRYHKKARRMSK